MGVGIRELAPAYFRAPTGQPRQWADDMAVVHAPIGEQEAFARELLEELRRLRRQGAVETAAHLTDRHRWRAHMAALDGTEHGGRNWPLVGRIERTVRQATERSVWSRVDDGEGSVTMEEEHEQP